MHTLNQRWREGRDSYRPAEPIDTRAYEVAQLAGDGVAKPFALSHHYSGSYVAARFRFGLYRSGELAGVAVFSHPVNDRVIVNALGVSATEGVELGRFVLLDHVPGNGETWFLARCFEVLRKAGLAGVVSFSDPGRRTNAAGLPVFGGHVGTIYQAHNAAYLGRGTARILNLLPSGRALNQRTVSKIQKGEVGWRYAVRQLVAEGAPAYSGGDLRTWLSQALLMCRKVKHLGCHKYAWAFCKAIKLGTRHEYPKQKDQ